MSLRSVRAAARDATSRQSGGGRQGLAGASGGGDDTDSSQRLVSPRAWDERGIGTPAFALGGVRHFARLVNASSSVRAAIRACEPGRRSARIRSTSTPGLLSCHLAPWIRLSRARDRENGGMAAEPSDARGPVTSRRQVCRPDWADSTSIFGTASVRIQAMSR
jgi:hypothetical protein